MAGTDTAVVRLSDLRDGSEGVCFAALVKKDRGMTKKNEPFFKCYFRDKRATLEAPIWANNRFLNQAAQWPVGIAYRLHVRTKDSGRYGLQIDEIIEIRAATAADEADGYDFQDLVESSRYSAAVLRERLDQLVDKYIRAPHVKRLVRDILAEHDELFRKMPAAQNFHHSYSVGLLEHVWSMTRIAGFVAEHYERYYDQLNPPLDKDVVVAATILHDIGKLRELEYHPVEAKYTKEGSLIGHVLMGRDLVREAAGRIEGFPEETLLLLEHAILAHHGKREFGAPVVPQTLEALILSFIDDLDAKINVLATERLRSTTEDAFTDRVYALDNRRIYKGIPVELPGAEDDGLA
ncbi:MAG TPA: HD domain-containing protein [Isosphaeraceae bacterium]|jgi:3'-5' exoribonuclease|nr:HD domain-containing protein [Isosphaeraceae bacterium]